MKQFRFHLPQLPHVIITDETTSCAFSQKVRKFARMMRSRGHHVIFYGHARSEVERDEFVEVTDDAVLQESYGDYDWQGTGYRHNVQDLAFRVFNERMSKALPERAQAGDILCLPFGTGHEPVARVAESLGVIPVETGIGHSTGSFARWRIYESHAIRAAVEGAGPQNWYSRVIPNYFDLEDFDYSESKQPWVLYLGRITELKGITTCIRATAAAGAELVIAGQGNMASLGYETLPDHVRFVGYADRETRRGLMSRASALIVASTYLEPFGGVQVEALLSGTPIITPGFGAFAEVNQHETTGFHCWTLRDFRDAVIRRWEIDPAECRAAGLRYTLDRVAPEFERYFEDVQAVYQGAGWNQL